MLIYEKENRLNINFENSVNETPDIQIGKDGDKTQILVDGKSSGGSGGGNVLTLYSNDDDLNGEETPKLYKNIECTEGYSSVEEANEVLFTATFIHVADVLDGGIVTVYFPLGVSIDTGVPEVLISGIGGCQLYIENGESEEPEIPDPGGSR